MIFLILMGAFLRIPFLYFLLHKSWFWQTLEHVIEIFSCCNFHNASKEYFLAKKNLDFMHGLKSAILAIFQFCHYSTFEPVDEVQKFFWSKDFF